MKKFIIALLAIIAVLGLILFAKIKFSNTTKPSKQEIALPLPDSSSPYSSEDIEKLIQKGIETLSKETNVYYESGTEKQYIKHYYKDSILKDVYYYPTEDANTVTNKLTVITYFDKHHSDKFRHTTKTKESLGVNLGNRDLFQSKITEYLEKPERYSTTFVYVKDEEFDGKDCILVKAYRYDTIMQKVKPHSALNDIRVYWIEKNTGFLVGYGALLPDRDVPTKTGAIKNVSFGTVKDSDLAEPEL